MGISLLVFNMKFLTKHPSKSEKPCNKIFYCKNPSLPKSEYLLPSKLEWDILTLTLYSYLHWVEFPFPEMCLYDCLLFADSVKFKLKKKKFIMRPRPTKETDIQGQRNN